MNVTFGWVDGHENGPFTSSDVNGPLAFSESAEQPNVTFIRSSPPNVTFGWVGSCSGD